jgi:pyruvate,water dikinase
MNAPVTADTSPLVLPFSQVGPDDLGRVGGKGANLGSLARAGFPVPPGFCVTTAAYDRFISPLAEADDRFQALEALDGSDVEATRRAAQAMRAALDALPLPPDVAGGVVAAWKELGTTTPLAVRSSATAEDLPGASFAGQQDTYLNIRGEQALLDAVRRCWISLFTDRAVLYRARSGFGHRKVRLSVVVQALIDPDVSGILFTADPISGHRGTLSIDAGFGLGEALVGGLISADRYKVDRETRAVIEAAPGDKALAIRSRPEGGTRQEALPEPRRFARSLDDAQVLLLADLGTRIEAHYGGVPQDIEWCLAQGMLYILQARPITSLFPIPSAHTEDGGLRIFLSFGHIQMMTAALPRLAGEVWRYFFPAGKGGAITPGSPARLSPALVWAGGRLYADATVPLRARRPRAVILALLGYAYADLARSVALLTTRPAFERVKGSLRPVAAGVLHILGPVLRRIPATILAGDPARSAVEVDRALRAFVEAARGRITAEPTPAARIRQSARELNAIFSQVRTHLRLMVGGVLAHRILATFARRRWAEGVRDEVEALLRGLPGNVTTEMDLTVGDLTDLVRPHEELARLLRTLRWVALRPRLPEVPGGVELATALTSFLERYGDRGPGEIDISKPRWRDDPSMLLRVISGGLASESTPGAHRARFARQTAIGEAARQRLVEAAGRGPWGPLRRWFVRRLCSVARFGMGLREHPKFVIVQILGSIRAQVLEAGALLAERGQLASPGDVWHLSFEELALALDDPRLRLREEVARREEEFRRDQGRKPPLVVTSEGETPVLAEGRADLPPGALAGTAASNGIVEGLARIIRDPENEVLHTGEILVAHSTDPGWTPLFVHAAGVVTEVGGVLTHGGVVAREYGIPAVVSVTGALERIRSGQRLRVDGTRGFVQILGAEPAEVEAASEGIGKQRMSV